MTGGADPGAPVDDGRDTRDDDSTLAWRPTVCFNNESNTTSTMSMATYNSTSWARALRYLRSVPETVRVVMLQEHHLMTTDALRRAQAAAGASGWKVLYEPATPSAGSDRSPSFNTGGVAIAVRAELTIVRQDPRLAPGRLIAATVSGEGLPVNGILCVSAYLYTGQQDSQDNRELLALVGQAANQGRRGYVIGADFQMAPSVVAGNGLPRRLDASIVAPTGSHGTIRGTG